MGTYKFVTDVLALINLVIGNVVDVHWPKT